MSSSSQHSHSELPELLPTADGHKRCAGCERVIYSDPKLAVAAIVPFDDGILLVKRGIEPAYGMWSFPSGYVNRGEVVERALEREVLEETRLQVTTGHMVGLFSSHAHPVVLAVYEVEVVGGTLEAADETLEVGVFASDRLPELAFEHDDRIINAWAAGR